MTDIVPMQWHSAISNIFKKKKRTPANTLLSEGIRLIGKRQYAAAVTSLNQALDAEPDSPDVLTNLGAAHMLNGDSDAALLYFEHALSIDQTNWPALINAAHLHRQSGEIDWIVNHLDANATWTLCPPDVVFTYTRACIDLGMYSKARTKLNARRQHLQAHTEFWLQLGVAHQYLNSPIAAEACFRKHQSLIAPTPSIRARHGRLLGECGAYGAARAVTHKALKRTPQSHDCLIAYGRSMEVLGETSTSEVAYETAIEQNPISIEALTNIGNVKKQTLAFDEAETYYRKGIDRKPDSAVMHRNFADLLGKSLRSDQAIKELETAAAIAPSHPNFVSDLAFAQHYSARYTPDDLATASQQAGQAYEARGIPARLHPQARKHPPLRIGLLSSNFRQHPVGFLALPSLEHLDQDHFTMIGFANQLGEDQYTDRFQQMCSRWHRVAHLADDQLEALIRESRIDVLIEMSGHASGHRLPVVARKVAPVQIKWIGGQFNTMGMHAIDYFLSDKIESPPEHDALYTERIYRLPNAYACYQPPRFTPDVSPLPALTNGHITFGSLNKVNKVNADTVSLWSRCLTKNPDSRFIIQGEQFADVSTRTRLLDLFEKFGVAASRIECRHFAPHPDLFRTYQDIDLCLDTYPYSGCLTTCESLWMGVPVVTLPGPTFAGRHAASFLTAVGLSNWIAENPEAYVALALDYANDIERLSDLRSSLRMKVAQSPLCDSQTFAENLGTALNEMFESAKHFSLAG